MKCNCYCLMQPCLTKIYSVKSWKKKKRGERKNLEGVCVCVGGGGDNSN